MISKILCFSLVTLSLGAFAQTKPANLSDSLDKNNVPSSMETREKVEEPRNLPDSIDRNNVPAEFEERQKEEEPFYSDDTTKGSLESDNNKMRDELESDDSM